jgi:hypothetical protein
MTDEAEGGNQRVYGGLLIGFALLSVLGAAHHPVTGAHDLQGALRSLAGSGMITGMHGFILAVFVMGFVGFCGFAQRLGLARPLALAGLVLMSLGVAAMISAGAINGFAVPAFAAHYEQLQPGEADAVQAMLRMSWAYNQAFASIGAALWGGALILWSAELVRRGGAARAVGLFGLIGGAALLIGLMTGLLALDVHGFLLITALLALWAAAIGALMLNRRLPAL